MKELSNNDVFGRSVAQHRTETCDPEPWSTGEASTGGLVLHLVLTCLITFSSDEDKYNKEGMTKDFIWSPYISLYFALLN